MHFIFMVSMRSHKKSYKHVSYFFVSYLQPGWFDIVETDKSSGSDKGLMKGEKVTWEPCMEKGERKEMKVTNSL